MSSCSHAFLFTDSKELQLELAQIIHFALHCFVLFNLYATLLRGRVYKMNLIWRGAFREINGKQKGSWYLLHKLVSYPLMKH